MKRVLIASLFSLAAAPVLATTPSFNDFPEQGQLDAGVLSFARLFPPGPPAAQSAGGFPVCAALRSGLRSDP